MTKRLDIIDREALDAQLGELASWSGVAGKARGRMLEILKEALAAGRATIRTAFESERLPGDDVVVAIAELMDDLIGALYDFTVKYVYPVANPTRGEQIAVAATGGYGRGELAPFSDIDLMFLMPYKRTAYAEQIAEYMLYTLWDLGLKVGHATRSIEDCVRLAKGDLTIRTSLLDSRFLWGDKALFAKFEKSFHAEVVAPFGAAFVEEKLSERDARHDRMGDSRYVLEPNVKEGKGGLRDLQTLFWIAKFLYGVDHVRDLVKRGALTSEDAQRFRKARNFLWTVRCHLHYLAGRPEERVAFNIQSAIAERMGYADRAGARGVERFMKHYFLVAKDVGDLTRILCAVWEDEHKKKRRRFRLLAGLRIGRRSPDGFEVDGDRLTVTDDGAFKRDPVKLIRLFHEAQRGNLDIHPKALRLVTQNLGLIDAKLRADPEANRLFMEMLCEGRDPETALKRLNEAGVFGRFIPDFGRVVAQMQYDMYHVYTVDEHTIRAIGILKAIEKGELIHLHPVASSVIGEVQARRALYVALLLHDLAKGRGGDHSEAGARIARKLGPRLGLDAWETETASWLILQHLTMSRTAFKRDIDDPKTVADFVEVVQSPERLRMLLVLTVADIRAVGPDVWNGWKATLLRELYYRAAELMTGGLPTERRGARVEEAKATLAARLTDWSAAEIAEHLARGYSGYWLAFDIDAQLHHARMIRAAEAEGRSLHIETRIDAGRDVTEIIIYAPDHAGLFSQIAGAMALTGASIVDAKIVTLTNGMALDTFGIQDSKGGPFSEPRALKTLQARIAEAISGRLYLARELEAQRTSGLPSRTRVFTVAPHVVIDNQASNQHTLIEVNGRDRLGFLYDVTATLTGLGLQIASAHISTYGERVVDVFYVKDVFGLKVERESKLKEIEQRLLEAIAPPPADAAEAKAKAAAG
jgi:[protein-PII] uridylyltransferase